MNVSGASSLLAPLKRGHRGEGRRVLQNDAAAEMPRQTSRRGCANRVDGARFRPQAQALLALCWSDVITRTVGRSCCCRSSLTHLIEGEAVLAELDGLDLVAAHSISP